MDGVRGSQRTGEAWMVVVWACWEVWRGWHGGESNERQDTHLEFARGPALRLRGVDVCV